jgi:exoribonuclease R
MQLDSEGRIESYEIVEGVIRSAARMTYTEVHAILEGDARPARVMPPWFPTSSGCGNSPG